MHSQSMKTNIFKEGQLLASIAKARKVEKEYEWQQEGLIQVLQQQKFGLAAGSLMTKDT